MPLTHRPPTELDDSRQERHSARQAQLSRTGEWKDKFSAPHGKPSTISTPALHPLPGLHAGPIKPVVYRRSYSLDGMGDLILGRVSHLDAFSGYLDRT